MDLHTSGLVAGMGLTMASRYIPDDWRYLRTVGAVIGLVMIVQFPINVALKFAGHESPVWRSTIWVAGILIALSIALGAILYLYPILWRFIPNYLSPTVPLAEAGARLFGEARETGSIEMAEKSSKSTDDMLDAMGNLILHHVAVKVRRPPSQIWHTLPHDEVRKVHASNGATAISFHGGNEPYYRDPRVSLRDLAETIIEIRKLDEGHFG
jgi:hypothetical protein